MIKQKHVENQRITTVIIDDREDEIGSLKEKLEMEKNRLEKLGVNTKNNVLSDQNIAEILGTHPTPMTHSLFCTCFSHNNGAIKIGRNVMGYSIQDELNEGFQIMVAGQPRCSIVHDALSYRIKGIPLEDYSRLINYYLKCIENSPQLANYPEIILYEQNPSLNFLESIFGEKAAEYKAAYDAFFRNIRILEKETVLRCNGEFIPRWETKIKELEMRSDKAGTVSEMIEVIRKTVEELRTDACVMFVLVARLGFFAYARLKKELRTAYGSKEGLRKLDIVTSGSDSDKNPTNRLTLELYKLKQDKKNLEKIVSEFGHIGLNELEIGNPRLWENSAILLNQARQITTDPAESFRNAQIKSKHEEEEIVRDHPELVQDIKTAKAYLPLRESVKFEYLKGYNLIRKMLKKIEKKLAWPEDLIFFLALEEVVNLNPETGKLLLKKAENRRKELERKKGLYVPTILDTRNLHLIGKKDLDRKSRTLSGIGVTDGIIEGEVVRMESVYDQDSARLLAPGKILVTETTDPSWSPYIGAIIPDGGLITEIGGYLSHGAIISRELGIAAVVNVPHVTKLLRTGMKVKLDASNGTVEIL